MPRETQSQSALPEHEAGAHTTPDQSADQQARQRAAAVVISREAPTPRERWQKLLGSFLGGQLYDTIVREASADDLLRLGKDAFDSAARALGKSLSAASPQSGNAILDRLRAEELSQELQRAVAPVAQAYLAGPGKALATSLATHLQESPLRTTALLILAAASAYAADLDLPELRAKLGLGAGFDLGASAQLGSFKNLALESIGVSLAWQGAGLKTQITAERLDGDRAVAATSSFRPRLLAGTFDDDAVVTKLSADMSRRLDVLHGGSVALHGESFLQHGRLLSGSISANLSMNVDEGTRLGLGVSQGFGPGSAGTGMSFRMQVHERFTFEGKYDQANGTYVGILVRIPL